MSVSVTLTKKLEIRKLNDGFKSKIKGDFKSDFQEVNFR